MKRKSSRFLALLLVVMMVVTMLPTMALAEGEEATGTFTQITTAEELVNGKYVMVVDTGYAMSEYVAQIDGKGSPWILAEELTAADGKVIDPAANLAWTLTVDGSSIKLTDANGVTVAPKGEATNGIISKSEYYWTYVFDSGTFSFTDVNETVTLASNKNSQYKFRAYNNATTVDKTPASYPHDFTLYKLEEDDSLKTGDKVVIYNPGAMKTLSSDYNGGFYNVGTTVTEVDGAPVGYTEDDIWTVTVNADGTYSFAFGGENIGMGEDHTSMPLGGVNDKWNLTELDDGLYNIDNVGRAGYYIQWYSDKGTWSAYNDGDVTSSDYMHKIYKVTGDTPVPGEDLPKAGDELVIYNKSSEGVLAGQDDNVEKPSVMNAKATIADGKATAENGTRVFTVEINGNDEYLFKTEHDGYLTSGETGNSTFFSKEATDYSTWTLEEFNGGYRIKSVNAKYGTTPQYLEYFSGAYVTYSYKDTDRDVYTFSFYPVADDVKVTKGIVNEPAVSFTSAVGAYANAAYEATFTVDAVFGVEQIAASYKLNEGEAVDAAAELVEGVYSFTIPANAITGEGTLTITVTGKDNENVDFSAELVVTIKDEPVLGEVTPAAGSQTAEDKKPEISVKFENAGETPTATLTLKYSSETVLDEVEMTVADGKASYKPAEDLADGRYTATVTVKRDGGKSASKTWSFTVGEINLQLYFGQLHSHTNYSDGSGSLESALEYIAALKESDNVDFVAFTDHSNYFDEGSAANPEGALYDMSLATAYSQETWASYNDAIDAFNKEQNDVIALAGFEMTWSGGPGHINTFNTEGIVSRNNSTLNSKTADAGMKAYYKLLSENEGKDSISQFNHPGETFGTFSDFAYMDPIIDSRIQLIEVGNGEGAIGAGGYYPSYEYYTMALDKGWHLSPTNNQDNHKGKWGNANDARDVILTEDFSEDGLYDAIRNHSLYATEDKNLEIGYTVNGMQMGSSITEVPESLDFNVIVSDPDTSDSIAKVEVIANSGRVAHVWNSAEELASGSMTVTLSPDYSYYYIRVTQGDGNIAVTSPIWVGDAMLIGVSNFECETSVPVTNEALTLKTTVFNSEDTDATVKSIIYTVGDTVIGTDETGYTVPASNNLYITHEYTPTEARVMTVVATVVIEFDEQEYTFTKSLELDVLDADKLVYIGIDASHYNEYVAGNYKDSMGNFSKLAAEYSVRTVELKTSDELIAACDNSDGKYVGLILTAPSRRLAAAQTNPGVYSEAELTAIKAFNAAGGTVVLAGWSDYYENYDAITSDPDIKHMAETQNDVLVALGSSLRISDDATHDKSLNGGQSQRLYFNAYNFDSFLVDRVIVDEEKPNDRMETEVYSHYGGASIYAIGDALADTVTPVVFGHSSTYSEDSDKDGLGGDGIPKYAYAEGDERLMVLATDKLEGQGLIVVSGAAFMSNFEVQATLDNVAEKNYSNYKICENLLNYLNPAEIADIADVQAEAEEGMKYTIRGIVTSNASGYDKDTAFFDCIYVQDETAGINAFPVAGDYKIGDLVQITGTTSSYQGERQIAVTKITKLGKETPIVPKEITTKEAAESTYLGSLVKIGGVVVDFTEENGVVQTIIVRDDSGEDARVFIDGYITTSKTIANLAIGEKITVVGLSSYDTSFDGAAARIRVRDRADIVCGTPAPPVIVPDPTPGDDFSFVDVPEGSWYHDAVYYLYDAEIIDGVTDTQFAPNGKLNRATLATMIYRLSGEKFSGTIGSFEDVKAGAWYAEAVEWAASTGVVNGITDTLFAPENNITREQAVTMLFRFAQYKGLDTSKRADISTYTDGDEISSYAKDAMLWAVATGIIEGRADDVLAPADGASRAEAAVVITRFMKYYSL